MRPSGQHQPARWLARLVGVGAALALACVVGTRADASCGDWLEGHAMAAHVGGAPAAQKVPDSGSTEAGRGTPRPRRCDGPACRKAPGMPLTPAESPAVALDHDRDALINGCDPAPAANAVTALEAGSDPLPSALSDRPERPPRGC